MRVSKQLKTAFWGLLSSSLSLSLLSLSGCMPPASSAPDQPKTTMSTLSESASKCEALLRSQMLTKSFVLEPESTNDSEIAFVKAAVPLMKDGEFSVQKVRGENSQIEASYSAANDLARSTMSYKISRASKESTAAFELNIEVQLLTFGKSSTKLSESFLVDNSCHPALSSKTLEKLTTVSTGHFLMSSATTYSDGKSEPKNVEFSVPEGGELVNLSVNAKDVTKIPANGFLFVGREATPYARIDLPKKSVKQFGLKLNLRSYEIKISARGKTITLSVGVDPKAGVELSVVGGRTSWKIPEAIWLNEKIGSSSDLNEFIKSDLPNGYLAVRPSLILEASRAPSYEHFDAYWTKTTLSTNTTTGIETFKLVENSAAATAGPSTPEDLESNNTIQTHLPAIEKISKAILGQAPSDKAVQVQLILDYLATNYSFDTEMVKNNVVRPLTTSEALDRGKGVCQHYAVIFTTLARAMGIPTRIIMGYFLSDAEVGEHAWNEVQIEPGLWRVIEPQKRNSLSTISLRHYLPVLHALILENKDSKRLDFFADLVSLDWIIRPAN